MEEVASHDWSLAVNFYVQKENNEEPVNIKELNAKIARTVSKEEEARKDLNELIEGLGF